MKTFSSKRIALAALVLVIAKLWLVAAQPVYAIGGAGHDDRLYLALADYILQGRWLGPYSEMTLCKGPGYPLFIAANTWLGIPLPLGQHLAYLLGAWLMVRAVRPLLRNDWWALALFALIWWQPMSFEMSVLGRVLRQHLYTPATMFVFAGMIGMHTRRSTPRGWRFAWAAVAGGGFAAMWLTRDETIWIVPSVVLFASVSLWLARCELGTWRRHAAMFSTAAAVAGVPLLIVSTLNLRAYGWFGTVEFRAPQFLAAYGALARVEEGERILGVPVSRTARLAIYEVSPAFAELRPLLEGDLGRGWAIPSAMVTHRPPEERELASGWWMWALRQAVGATGHAHSAREALEFYQKIADEVNAACDSGRLKAGPNRETMLPVWDPVYTERFLAEGGEYLAYFATFRGFTAHTPRSEGEAWLLALFRDMTGARLAPSKDAPELDLPRTQAVSAWRIHVLQRVGKVLRFTCAGGVFLGLAAFVLAGEGGLLRRTMPGFLWWTAGAAIGGCLSVVGLNFVVHITSFPNLSPGAFAQAYPLAAMFAVLSVHEAVAWVRERKGNRP